MKQLTLILFFLCIAPILTLAQSSQKMIEPNHQFSITFTHNVALADVNQHIQLTCVCHVDYTFKHGQSPNNILIIPSEPLIQGQLYTVKIHPTLQNTSGKILKKANETTFLVKQPKAVTATFNSTLTQHISTYHAIDNDHLQLFGSPSVPVSTLNTVSEHFEKQMLPYFAAVFPELNGATKKPTIIMLANDNEMQLYKHAGGEIVEGAYGWVSYKDNVIVLKGTYLDKLVLAHEYFHWLIWHIYELHIPTWINEAAATLFSWHYFEQSTSLYQLSKVQNSYMHLNKHPIQPNALYITYSNESIAALALLLEQNGIASFASWLRQAKEIGQEQAWQSVYKVSFNNTKHLIETFTDAFEQQTNATTKAFLAYDQATSLKPIIFHALPIQTQLFNTYTLHETAMLRIYADPSLPPEIVNAYLHFSNVSLKPLFEKKKERSVLILASENRLSDFVSYPLQQLDYNTVSQIYYDTIPGTYLHIGKLSNTISPRIKQFIIESYDRRIK